MDSPKTADDVKALADERGIRFIRLWFTDILGQLKSFSINAEALDDAFEGGMGFDGSSITGFNAIEESDMIAMPDPTTFNALPWRPEGDGGGVARMFADIQTPLVASRAKLARSPLSSPLPSPSRNTSTKIPQATLIAVSVVRSLLRRIVSNTSIQRSSENIG